LVVGFDLVGGSFGSRMFVLALFGEYSYLSLYGKEERRDRSSGGSPGLKAALGRMGHSRPAF